ncbi:MAG: type II toxin-antitoxin system VapC family toxin [Gemmataceae bacterium]|nr:type II toxin-antitoxin system VapC family toxin [Planctomycetia bacterium]MBX3398609.1 type II toxin-antitoxin system VapC family toxin [Gemmataceae bacterium]
MHETNAWIEYLCGKDAMFIARVNARPTVDLALSTIVLGELLYGAYHSGPGNVAKRLLQVERLRKTFENVPFDMNSAEEYGKLRDYLARQGLLIGSYDMLIAATAVANGLTLVTHNTAEFGRVPGLAIEDWQSP